MRQSKIIKVGDREITVKEISPSMAIALFKPEPGQGLTMAAVDALCREGCGLSVEELSKLYGSELAKIWEAFRELNDFFFKIAASFGLENMLAKIGAIFVEIFNSELPGLLKSDTSTPPTTAGPTSC